jgi:N-acetylmuramoyl-L-alanine amidase
MPHFPIKSIVVHYSATPRGRHHTVEDIDAWHKARGWKGIGYHYVIYLDGSVHKGRPDNEVGAHVANHNTGSLGVCWIGGTDNGKSADTRTPAQTASLIALIKKLLAEHPGARVVGHRDMPGAATECPGFDVIPWWFSVVNGPPNKASRPEHIPGPVTGGVTNPTTGPVARPTAPPPPPPDVEPSSPSRPATGFWAWLLRLLGFGGK